MDVKESQKRKVPSYMRVTFLGMTTETRLLQLEKAYLSIFFTLLGIMMETKAEQLAKASGPILVTLLGMLTDVRLVQSANNPLLI